MSFCLDDPSRTSRIDRFERIRISEATSPLDKDVVQVYNNYYWIIFQDRYIVLNRNGGPMCNSDVRTLEHLKKGLFKSSDYSIKQLDTVFIPWDTSEYTYN